MKKSCKSFAKGNWQFSLDKERSVYLSDETALNLTQILNANLVLKMNIN